MTTGLKKDNPGFNRDAGIIVAWKPEVALNFMSNRLIIKKSHAEHERRNIQILRINTIIPGVLKHCATAKFITHLWLTEFGLWQTSNLSIPFQSFE